jgi:hypothetical protein
VAMGRADAEPWAQDLQCISCTAPHLTKHDSGAPPATGQAKLAKRLGLVAGGATGQAETAEPDPSKSAAVMRDGAEDGREPWAEAA